MMNTSQIPTVTMIGELTVGMVDYIKTIIADMPKDMKRTAKTLAGYHPLKVSDNPVLLNKEDAELFHRMVMQLLYLCQSGRPNLWTAAAFLTRRTNAPDEDDNKKKTRDAPPASSFGSIAD